MSKRRLERPVPVAGKRRQVRVRPRYGRISAAGGALAITGITLLGGVGVLPSEPPAAASSGAADVADTARAVVQQRSSRDAPVPAAPPSTRPTPTTTSARPVPAPGPTALPAGSGSGRRVVFDLSSQRVWLVGENGSVERTYLVSGSLTDNLGPGSYEVYSRSRWAVGIDDSGTMQYFVRFAHGPRAAIGFHTIPVKDGQALQTRAQLGTPQSHGCIRQARPDAVALWEFAPEGTPVVVTA